MKRYGPPMIDRRLKRQQTRHEVERLAEDDSAEPCQNCGRSTYRWGGFCSRECAAIYDLLTGTRRRE